MQGKVSGQHPLSMAKLLLLGFSLVQVVVSDLTPRLAERQLQCGVSSGYFPACGGCCYDVGLAGCYSPLTIIAGRTFTGLPACYTTPPGRIITTENAPAGAVATTTAVRPSSSAAVPASATTCGATEKACRYYCIDKAEDCCPDSGYCDAGYTCQPSTGFNAGTACCRIGGTCGLATRTTSSSRTVYTTPSVTPIAIPGSASGNPTVAPVPIAVTGSSASITSSTRTSSTSTSSSRLSSIQSVATVQVSSGNGNYAGYSPSSWLSIIYALTAWLL